MTKVQRTIVIAPASLSLSSYVDKNFNLGHNLWTVADKNFIFHMCIPCDNAFSHHTIIFDLVTLNLKFDQLFKSLTLFKTYEPWEIELSYFWFVFLVTRPFTSYHNFWPSDLELEVWPTFQIFNLVHNLWTVRDRAFIFLICIPCDKTFHIIPYFFT